MAADKELALYLDGGLAGHLHQSPQGNTTFSYDDAYRAADGSTPLSLSMPLSRATFPSRVVTPFLQGLLPDSPTRLDELAREYQTSPRNPFSLLSHIGRDAAGAVQILPPGEDSPDAAQRQGDVTRLSASDFSDVIADLVAHADTWGLRSTGARWSLPGAQPKVALFRFPDGHWGIPTDSTPTTHIIKPAIAPFSEHDVNELMSMTAARTLGLPVASSEITTTSAGDRIFVSERYDRRMVGGSWVRLHQEDLCQALSYPPDLKYQSDGGPGIAEIAQLFARLPHLGDREASRLRFFDAVVFNATVAATDAHAKNFSILLSGDRARLAPLYDLGTHAPYPHSSPLMSAMKVGDEYRLDAIGESELMKSARKLRVPDDVALDRIEYIRSNIIGAYESAAASLGDAVPLQSSAQHVLSSISSFVESRGWNHEP